MIITCLGRRIDLPDATIIRFLLNEGDRVSRQGEPLFHLQSVSFLISSAACGAN
ncbi:MAG: hypothetical protein AB7P17_12640 [Nitrospirales bacterium]